jgi:putative membrane protein
MNYLWLKTIHIVAMTAWFSGLFYLPRLFVYHAMSVDEISVERFKIMERKLYYGITWPSAIITSIFGVWMLTVSTGLLQQPWLHIKLTLVLLLWCYHLLCGFYLKQFANNNNNNTHIFFRWFNEVPVIFLVAIVWLVIFKPM